jgi:hypothetical protein
MVLIFLRMTLGSSLGFIDTLFNICLYSARVTASYGMYLCNIASTIRCGRPSGQSTVTAL